MLAPLNGELFGFENVPYLKKKIEEKNREGKKCNKSCLQRELNLCPPKNTKNKHEKATRIFRKIA